MNIVFCIPSPADEAEKWVESFSRRLPNAKLSLWNEGERGTDADYAIVRKPTASFFSVHPQFKAIFNLGAGIDGLLKLDTLPVSTPVIKLDDAGMAGQMIDYVTWAVLRYVRQFDVYEQQQSVRQWRPLDLLPRSEFTVGIMGLGVLGSAIAREISRLGLTVSGWSRSRKQIEGVESYAGDADLVSFLKRTRILVCTLPLTQTTKDILNRCTLGCLPRGSYLINVARGDHLVEQDLLDLLNDGHLAGATLDVFRQEPLPPSHPFWNHSSITITPHVSASVLREESVRQIVEKLSKLARGERITGVISRGLGY